MTLPLDFRRFCVALVSSQDLDPVYVGAVATDMPPDQLRRWLLAYGMFYHVGAASWLSEREGVEFWDCIAVAAANIKPAPHGRRWPRASERRHFRGAFAIRCAVAMATRYPRPEGFMDHVASFAPDVQKVRAAVEDHLGFGDWASFKFADLVDRVLGRKVKFDLATAMYETPIKGAKLVWDLHRTAPCPNTAEAVWLAQGIFEEATAGLTAPPLHDRPLSFNELETCLCKFKSHRAGRYPIGKDINECLHASGEWASYSPTAAKMHSEFTRMKEDASCWLE